MPNKFEGGENLGEQFPTVSVQEVTDEQITELTQENKPRGVNLGGAHSESARGAETNVNNLMSRIRKSGGRRFILSWEGNKVPRGARVLDHEIAWTQNGQVSTTSGEGIGTYDRLVEFGGTTGKEQKMVVYLYPEKKKE